MKKPLIKGLIAAFLTLSTSSAFSQDYSLSFDGTDDEAVTGSTLDHNESFTYEFWIKSSGISLPILSGDGSSYVEIGISSSGAIQYSASSGGSDLYEGTIVINDGQWHHVAVLRDFSEISVYVDGKKDIPFTYSQTISAASFSGLFQLGLDNLGSVYFSGELDEVRVWSERRSVAQINEFRFQSVPDPGSDETLIAYYPFNEGSGNAIDHSFNVNDAVISGGPTYVTSGAFKPVALLPTDVTDLGFRANWLPTPGATDLRIDIDDNSDFLSPFATDIGVIDPTTGSSFVYQDLSSYANQELYYRIQFDDELFTSSYSDGVPFMVGAGNALDFDGTDDEITFSLAPEFSGSGTMTFEAWINLPSITGTFTLTSWTDGVDQVARFQVINGNLDLFEDDGTQSGSVTGSTAIVANEWTHVAFVETVGSIDFYVNGVQESMGNPVASIGLASQMALGTNTLGTNYFSGQIDEVRIWDVARSSTEINDHLYTTLSGNEDGLLTYYRFDETSGSTLSDGSGLDYHGLWGGPSGANTTANWVTSLAMESTTAPAIPTNIIAYSTGANVALEWQDNSNDETAFIIEKASDYAFTTPITAGTLASNTNNAFVTDDATNRFYRVLAQNSAGNTASAVEFGSTDVFPGYAVLLDGVDDQLTVPDNSQLSFGNGATDLPFSVEAWVYLNTTGVYQTIVNKRQNGVNREYRLAITTTNEIEVLLTDESTVGYLELETVGFNIQSGQWYHIAFSYDGSSTPGGLALYINGSEYLASPTSSNYTAMEDTPADLEIGADAGLQYFDGQIDEVRVWDYQKTDYSDRFSDLQGDETGLVAYYNFNENTGTDVVDQSTSTNDGALTGSPTFIAATIEKTNNALDFDGADDYVSVGNSSPLQITGQLTYEAWLKTTAISGFIMGRRNSDAATGIASNLELQSDGTIQFVITDGAQASQVVQSVTAINDGTWHHVAAVYDPGVALRIFLDGQLDNEITTSIYSALNSAFLPFNLGYRHSGTPDHFAGQMDEVRVWNSVRDDQQILDNYLTELADAGAFGDLVAYYDFSIGIPEGNNAFITTLPDRTSNANNGTLNGFTLTGVSSNLVTSGAFAPPTAPSNLIATEVSETQVDLSWTDNSADETSFEIQYSVDEGVTWLNTLSANPVAADQTSVSLTDLTQNNNYLFRIVAENTNGQSPPSEEVFASTFVAPGNALAFDNTDYISAGTTPVTGTGPFTISAWFSTSSETSQVIATTRYSGGFSNIYALYLSAAGEIQFSVGDATAPNTLTSSRTALNDGIWHNVVAVRESDGTMNIYIDGTLDATMAQSLYSIAAFPLTLGRNIRDGGSNFIGEMDEVSVWITALSATDIATYFLQEIDNTHPQFANLFTYYKFDQTTGTSVKEETGIGSDATFNGTFEWVLSGALTPPIPPTPVSDLITTENSDGTVTLDWTDVPDETGYTIETSPDATTWSTETTLAADATTYTSGIVTAETGSYWRVVANGSGGSSAGIFRYAGNFTSFGNTLLFDGDDDYVALGEIHDFNTGAFTIEAWARQTSTGTTDWIVSNGVSPVVAGGYLHFGIGVAGGLLLDVFGTGVSSTPTITDLAWHHVAVAYDPASVGSEVEMFIDGVSVPMNSNTLPQFSGTNDLKIGQAFDTEFFGGAIDEVRVWDYARSEAEIQSTFDTTLVGNEAGLVAYYRFDQTGLSVIIPDRSTNYNFGAWSGVGGAYTLPQWTTSDISTDFTAPVVTVDNLITNAVSPELTGTVDDPAATIDVTVNGETVSGTNNGDGTWTVASGTLTDLSEGIYDVSVSATDAVDNVGTDVSTDELTIDLTPPVVTSDTLYTQALSPELTGTVDDPAATIDVTVNGETVSGTNNGDGTWTVASGTLTDLSEGIYDVSVSATDAVDNVGTDVSTNELVIDLTPPVVTSDTLYTQALSPELTGTIDDTTATVDVTINGSTYAAVNNGDGTWNLPAATITGISEADWNVGVLATDLAGNEGTVDGYLSIDLTAPAVTVDAVSTDDPSPAISGTVDDPDAAINITVDGNAYPVSNNGDGSWSLAAGIVADLAVGSYDVLVEATDLAGNISPANFPTIITILEPVSTFTALDSAALLTIYDALGGANWTRANNWQSGQPLASWGDVTISNGRVVAVDLSNNNLIGTFPAILTGLDAMTSLNLAANEITGFGDITSLTALSSLDVSNNRLQFNDLETLFLNFPSVVYSPQKTVLSKVRVVREIGEDYTIDRTVTGSANSYTWTKNGIPIAETNSSFTVSIPDFSADGSYVAQVTSSIASGVTLTTEPVVLRVSSLERDSTSLRTLYAALVTTESNVSDWTTLPIAQWPEVTIANNRVTAVDLSNQSLEGALPEDITDLQSLTTVNFMGNAISDLPEIGTSMPNLTSFNVSENALEFDDLEPNIGINGIDYSNQHKIGSELFEIIPNGENYNLSIAVGGAANEYQWYLTTTSGTLNNQPIGSATTGSFTIQNINYGNMGSYILRVTNPEVQDLTLESYPMEVLASADLEFVGFGKDDVKITEGLGYALQVTAPGVPFDSVAVIEAINGTFMFDDLVLGNYLIAFGSDPEIYLPTYFKNTDLWTEADTLRLRADRTDTLYMVQKPEPFDPNAGDGLVAGFVEANFASEASGGRIEARRKVKKAGCSLRRRTRGSGGRGNQEEDVFELVAYVETNDEGQFEFENIPSGYYRFNIEYPGIPMDPDSFVEFEIGEDGVENNSFKLEAYVTETGIEVILAEELGFNRKYFKDLKVYPNPADKVLNITYSKLMSESVVMRVLDLSGNVVHQQEISRGYNLEQQLNTTDLRTGLYLLTFEDISSGNKRLASFKIYISH